MSAKEEILKAADSLFGELGYEATSTREIAERSGVNKALIYYHYRNKEQLFEMVLDQYYEALSKLLLQSMLGEGKLRGRIHRMVDTYVDFLAGNRNFGRIVQREASGGKHQERIRMHMAPLLETGVQFVQQEFPQTKSGEMDASHLLVSLYGMIISYFTYSGLLKKLWKKKPLSKKSLEERKAHLRRLVDIVLNEIENGSIA